MNLDLGAPRTEVYVYDDDVKHWLPRVTRSRKIIVGLYDSGAPWDLSPAEHRVWNEHRLRAVTRPLRGEGVLTFVYRNDFHWGLTWSRHPLRAISSMTWVTPRWWEAEDIWCEVGDYRQLKLKVDAEQARLEAQWDQRVHVRRLEQANRPLAVVAEHRLAHIQDEGQRIREALRLMGQDANDYARNRQRG